jgi:hypothetical protein
LAYETTLRHKLAHGELIVSKEMSKDELFEHFAWKWFDSYVIPNNKYSEQRTKKYVLSAALIPYFGKMRVGEIGAYHIDRYKAHALKNGATNKTLKNRLTVLNKCLCTAYDWLGLSGSNRLSLAGRMRADPVSLRGRALRNVAHNSSHRYAARRAERAAVVFD